MKGLDSHITGNYGEDQHRAGSQHNEDSLLFCIEDGTHGLTTKLVDRINVCGSCGYPAAPYADVAAENRLNDTVNYLRRKRNGRR